MSFFYLLLRLSFVVQRENAASLFLPWHIATELMFETWELSCMMSSSTNCCKSALETHMLLWLQVQEHHGVFPDHNPHPSDSFGVSWIADASYQTSCIYPKALLLRISYLFSQLLTTKSRNPNFLSRSSNLSEHFYEA